MATKQLLRRRDDGAARPAGWRTASRSPARRTWWSRSRTSRASSQSARKCARWLVKTRSEVQARARRAGRSHRRPHDHPRDGAASTTAPSCSPRGSPRCCPQSYLDGIAARRARARLARPDRPRQARRPACRTNATKQRTGRSEEADRRAARLRIALRAAARVRRDARQPARHRRLPRARRGGARRAHGERDRAARPVVRAVQGARRSADAQDRGPLHASSAATFTSSPNSWRRGSSAPPERSQIPLTALGRARKDRACVAGRWQAP